MTRSDAIRKSIVLMDAVKRIFSKGNAGLEAIGPKYAESFDNSNECAAVLREMLREMEARGGCERDDTRNQDPGMRDWQKEIIENQGPPRMMVF